jgi:hypothetical protein
MASLLESDMARISLRVDEQQDDHQDDHAPFVAHRAHGRSFTSPLSLTSSPRLCLALRLATRPAP